MNFKAIDVVKSVLVYMAGNFRALLLVSIVPGVLMALLMVLQSWMQYSRVVELGAGGAMDGQSVSAMADTGKNVVLMLVMLPIYFWFSVKVVRLRLLGEGSVGLASNKELSCTYRYGLYSLAVMGILISAGLVVILVMLLLVGDGQSATPGIVPVLLFLVMSAALMYANTRFSAALPAVAVGLRPNLIKDMWSFAGEKTWPLLGWLVMIFIGFSLFVMLINMSMMSGAISAMQAGPQVYLEYLEANMARMVFVNLIFSLISIPFYWFYVLYFADAFEKIAAAKNIWRAPR